MKKLLALLLALVMVLGLAACGPTTTPTEPPTSAPTNPPTNPPTDPPTEPPTDPVEEVGYKTITPVAPDNDPYIVAKYTVTETADGWILVENEGGDTLSFSPDSGVSIIQVEGYAFKDLDQDGMLDGYEDWRRSSEDRAGDLVSQLDTLSMAMFTSHGGLGSFSEEAIEETNSGYSFIVRGGRGGVTRNASSNPAGHAKWNNLLQELAEAQPWGVPVMISVDPLEISNMVESVGLAATMDTDIAHAIGVETAKQYRAIGISALLGPQIDIASPVMDRGSGTYGEDYALTRDIAQAYVNAMQSTYAEDGTDLGWGADSVICFSKHFAGAGAAEGGRNDHFNPGRYTAFAGDNFEAHLIAYFDGVFNLPGLTGAAGVMQQYAVNVDSEGNPIGGEWGGGFNPYINDLLNDNWEGLTVSDWGVFSGQGGANWGVEDKTPAEAVVIYWEQGGDLLGGFNDMDSIEEAHGLLVNKYGEDGAREILSKACYDFILVEMNLELFEHPYCDSAYAAEVVWSEAANEYGIQTETKSIVMLKNDGTIAENTTGEKLTVYVPYVFTPASAGSGPSAPTPASWGPSIDMGLLEKYFNVVTDSVGEPTGEDGTYTENDVIRASADDIAACDLIIVSMNAPKTDSNVTTNEDGTETWTPASIQYAEYTADSEFVRQESLGGKVTVNNVYDNYGAIISSESVKENRSYYGQTAAKSGNYGDLELLQWVDTVAGEVPVVVTMQLKVAMCWHEVEPLADVILVGFGDSTRDEAMCRIISGQAEPYGLLICQQPLNMEAVEKQLEDVARDMECYVDANGNTYDFAFGLNWSGVINDERVATYSAEPLSKVEAFDFTSWDAAWEED